MAAFEDNFGNLEEWLKKYEHLSAQAPDLYKIYDIAKFNKSLLDSFPDSDTVLFNSVYQNSNEALSILIPNLPNIESIDQSILLDSYSASFSGSTASYSDVSCYMPNSPDEYQWKNSAIREFEKRIILTENSINSIEKFFSIVNAKEFIAEYTELRKEFEIYNSGNPDHVAFGFKLRNFIEHFKGVLKKAGDIEKFGRERDRKVSWPKLASDISLRPKGNQAEKDFIKMGSIWVDCHDFLSGNSKKFNGSDYDNYCNCYNTCISMLLTFTQIVDIEKIKKVFNN